MISLLSITLFIVLMFIGVPVSAAHFNDEAAAYAKEVVAADFEEQFAIHPPTPPCPARKPRRRPSRRRLRAGESEG